MIAKKISAICTFGLPYVLIINFAANFLERLMQMKRYPLTQRTLRLWDRQEKELSKIKRKRVSLEELRGRQQGHGLKR